MRDNLKRQIKLEEERSRIVGILNEKRVPFTSYHDCIEVERKFAADLHSAVFSVTGYLSDSQYLDLLKRARARLDDTDEAHGYDCTLQGYKDTQTNVGLCDDSLTTEETVLFPSEWPNRKSMRYREKRHKCPMDTRPMNQLDGNGCFYTCRFFKHGLRDLATIKQLYDDRIKEVEDEQK